MQKRKIAGILKYGTRSYPVPVKKLQEGGYVAVGSGYDWRDDPYEIMLLKNKAAQDIAKSRSAAAYARKSGSAKTAKDPTIPGFVTLKGGIPVTNDAINKQYQEYQKEFYSQVEANDPEWLTTIAGQRAAQQVINLGITLEEKAKAEETNFNDAFGKIKPEDRTVFAISANGNMMVRDKATGKGEAIDTATYLKGVEKYQPMTVDEFADWKRTEDTALQSGLTDEFLKGGAVGYNTIKATFIDGHEDAINLSFLGDGKIVRKKIGGGTDYVTDVRLFKDGVDALMKGFAFDTPQLTQQEVNKANDARAVANEVYTDIMAKTGDRSQLEASLTAEVLRDDRNKAIIFKEKDPVKKAEILEEQKRLALVSKLFDKNKKSSTGDGDSKSSTTDQDKRDPDAIAPFGGLMAFYNPSTVGQFTLGVGIQQGKQRQVADVNMPAVWDGIGPAMIKLEVNPDANETAKKQNNMLHNNAISPVINKSEFYLPGGQSLSKALGGKGKATEFIGDYTVIAPNESMPIVYKPIDSAGNDVTAQLLKLAPVKLAIRQKFIAATKGKLTRDGKPYRITTSAEQLLPGNIDSKKQSDTKEYQLWLADGMKVGDYQQDVRNNVPGAVARLARAKEARAAINQATAAFYREFKGREVTMQPMLGTWIIFDNDDVDFKGKMDLAASNGIGANMIKPANSKEKAFLQDVNGIDSTNLMKDNVYKMLVFNKILPLNTIAANGGAKLSHIKTYGDIQDKIVTFMSGQNPTSNPQDTKLVYEFLMQ